MAAIQRSELGRTFTLFQGFTINEFEFLTRDLLKLQKIRGAKQLVQQGRPLQAAKIIAATFITDVIAENVIGISSPVPNPIREFFKSRDEGKTISKSAIDAAINLTEPIPVLSSTRFGTSPLGPVVENVGGLIKSAQDRPLSKPFTEEFAKTVAGVPGTGQFLKTRRGLKRGQSIIQSILGTALEEKPNLPDTRGRRPRRPRR